MINSHCEERSDEAVSLNTIEILPFTLSFWKNLNNVIIKLCLDSSGMTKCVIKLHIKIDLHFNSHFYTPSTPQNDDQWQVSLSHNFHRYLQCDRMFRIRNHFPRLCCQKY